MGLELYGQVFFICYLAAPLLTLGHGRGGSLTNPIIIITCVAYSTGRSPVPSHRSGRNFLFFKLNNEVNVFKD